MDVEARRRERIDFMIAVYNAVDGKLGPPGVRTAALHRQTDLAIERLFRLREDCRVEGWIQTRRATYPGENGGLGTIIELTAKGRDLAEDSIIEQKKALRLRFLNHLYDVTGGDTLKDVNLQDVAKALEVNPIEAGQAYDFLRKEGLATTEGIGAVGARISITHDGVKEMEEARSGQSSGTAHFPVTVINNVFQNTGTITGSTVQQAGHHAQQTVTDLTPELRSQIEQLLSKLKSELAQAPDFNQKAYVEADAKAVEDELALPKPRPEVVKSRLAGILDNVAAGVLSGALVESLRALLGLLA